MTARGAALDFVAGCLSVRTGADADMALTTAIRSGRLVWPAVIDLGDAQLVTPALWVAVCRRGLARELPSNVRNYLWKSYLCNVRRNGDLRVQAISAVRVLNSIGIEPVLLKGGVSLFDETFGSPPSRIMADLDVLVPRKHAAHCWSVLRNNGYVPIGGDYDYSRHHHLMPLLCPDAEGRIEIHREALCNSAAGILPSSLIWEQATTVRESDVVFRIPDPTTRTLHNVLHATLVNREYARGDMSLRSLHELTLVQNLYERQIDWVAIRTLMDHGHKLEVLNAWLYAANRLFGFPLPSDIGPKPLAMAHYAWMRLRAKWQWTDAAIERAMSFSAPDICERYQCADEVVSVAKGRMHLAVTMAMNGATKALHRACRGPQNRRSIRRARQTKLEIRRQQQRT